MLVVLVVIVVILVALLVGAYVVGRKDTGSVRSGDIRRNALNAMRDLESRTGPNLVRRRDGDQ